VGASQHGILQSKCHATIVNKLTSKFRIPNPILAGAYELILGDDGQWESSLDCLVEYLEDIPRSVPRTPAWRYTFPGQEGSEEYSDVEYPSDSCSEEHHR
jgi:hypothetical protein